MRLALATLLAVWLIASCSGNRKAETAGVGFEEKGIASWYGPGFHGKRTANGEVYDMDAMTAAHKTLPFDLIVEVENLDNGRSTRVRINDRGPFVRGRIIDLSREAAKRIGMLGPGTARVRIRVVERAPPVERTGSFWVQVGAFRDRGNARALEARLKRDFSDVRIRSEDGWYRVGFGPFDKRSKADELARKLDRRGHDAVVVSAS